MCGWQVLRDFFQQHQVDIAGTARSSAAVIVKFIQDPPNHPLVGLVAIIRLLKDQASEL